MRVWGGYGPTPTYRLRLADGRKAFFKAVWPESDDFPRSAFIHEEQVYRELGDLIAPWAPAFLGAFQADGWQVLLLEDLGPKSAPPWTLPIARGVSRAFGDFHQTTSGIPLPPSVRPPAVYLRNMSLRWDTLTESDRLRSIASLAGDRADEALRWLEAAAPTLSEAGRALLEVPPPYALLHGDLRSDNLHWASGRLRLFDWPSVGIGPPEYDIAAFAQAVTGEDGPDPERIMVWYAEHAPVRPDALDASVAALAGYFADGSWQPDLPALPRLRRWQRRQLQVTLAWAARRLRLPEPGWLHVVSP